MEELTTLVIRIEGILNSRPISAFSSDPNDVSALTPGHLDCSIGQPLAAIPNRNVVDIPMNRLNRWQLIQQAQQSFWKRWSYEYLHTLQGRQKWFHDNPTFKIGNLVAINHGYLHRLELAALSLVEVSTIGTISASCTWPGMAVYYYKL